MGKLRVLWFGRMQTEQDSRGNGSWQDAMAQGLAHSGEVELANIAQGQVTEITQRDLGPIQQWVVPANARFRHGLPEEQSMAAVIDLVEKFSPEMIHVWGTEESWGLFTSRGLVRKPALLEMQGLRGAIARVFAGGLSLREQLGCIGLKEIVQRKTIAQSRSQFEQWGKIEREIIQGHRFITAQSEWLCAQIRSINPSSAIFHNDFMLREPFRVALPWQSSGSMRVFCSSAYASPFKGLHVALRAIAILRQRFPMIQLRIAGAHQKKTVRQDGYVRWLNRLTDQLGMADNVCWMGPLSASEIITELQSSAAMVQPSFIEGYSLAMAEAMMLGVPLACSFAGGMSSLARDEESALFFSPGDGVMCAYQLERLLTDYVLAERIGRQAREIALVRNDRERIVQRQIEIYRQAMSQPAST